MDSRLNIKLTINDSCYLNTIDDSNYETFLDFKNHVPIEYIIYDEESINEKNVIINNFSLTSKYELVKDGKYTYYKFILKKLEHYLISGSYLIKNKILYHNNFIYYALENINNISELQDSWIINYTEFQKLIDGLTTYQEIGINYNFNEIIFSICKINKCLILYQKKLIDDNLKNCSYLCKPKDKQIRDFLLDSVYLLNYLIKYNKFYEAQVIINKLKSCDQICSNNLNTNCNCG